MKKMILLLVMAIVLFMQPIEVAAKSPESNAEHVAMRYLEKATIERNIFYNKQLIPASSIYWQEDMGGAIFAGTLTLKKYTICPTGTSAVYVGTIYRQ